MNYAGATKGSNPVYISMYTDQCVVGWGLSLLHGSKRPAASVTSRPVPSISRSVGTTTRVADVKTGGPT